MALLTPKWLFFHLAGEDDNADGGGDVDDVDVDDVDDDGDDDDGADEHKVPDDHQSVQQTI